MGKEEMERYNIAKSIREKQKKKQEKKQKGGYEFVGADDEIIQLNYELGQAN